MKKGRLRANARNRPFCYDSNSSFGVRLGTGTTTPAVAAAAVTVGRLDNAIATRPSRKRRKNVLCTATARNRTRWIRVVVWNIQVWEKQVCLIGRRANRHGNDCAARRHRHREVRAAVVQYHAPAGYRGRREKHPSYCRISSHGSATSTDQFRPAFKRPHQTYVPVVMGISVIGQSSNRSSSVLRTGPRFPLGSIV